MHVGFSIVVDGPQLCQMALLHKKNRSIISSSAALVSFLELSCWSNNFTFQITYTQLM